MKEVTVNWTKEDLKIYILIYCANADFTESKFEIDMIKSKIQFSDFDKIHTEFEKDNDFLSIQKIQYSMREHNYSHEEIDTLKSEIKDLFFSDGKYDVLEENLFRGLSHLFNIL